MEMLATSVRQTHRSSTAVFINGLIKNQLLPVIYIALAHFQSQPGPIVTAHIIQNAASVSAGRPARPKTRRLQHNEKNKFSKRTEEPIERWSEVTAGRGTAV